MKSYKVVARINGQLESAICGKHTFQKLRAVIYKRGKPSVPHPKDGPLAYFKTRDAAVRFLNTEQNYNIRYGPDASFELWTCDVIDWPGIQAYWQADKPESSVYVPSNCGCASFITLRGKCKIS